jgi:hypothetical protein
MDNSHRREDKKGKGDGEMEMEMEMEMELIFVNYLEICGLLSNSR